MSEHPEPFSDDHSGAESAQRILHEQAKRNIRIVGTMAGLGLPLELAGVFGAKSLKQVKPCELTEQDHQRIAAAEAKRQRKAAKRVSIQSEAS